jgi:hypothetical protein
MIPNTENNPSVASDDAASMMSKESQHKKRRSTVTTIADIDSLSKLDFESFKSTDMNKLQAKIVAATTKMFGATVLFPSK